METHRQSSTTEKAPTLDRRLIEAMKLSPYIFVTFEFGDRPVRIKVNEKLFSHDVAIATQSYYLRKIKKNNSNQ